MAIPGARTRVTAKPSRGFDALWRIHERDDVRRETGFLDGDAVMSAVCRDSMTTAIVPMHARFKKGDVLVHIVAGRPTRAKWGTMACGALFQWEPGTEHRADRTHDAVSCIACLGYVGKTDW